MDPIIPQSQEQAPMDSTNLPQVPEQKHFLNKKFIITFVILLLLGAGAYAGIWYWGNRQTTQSLVVCPDGKPPSVCTLSIPGNCWCDSATLSSLVYRANGYGFSIALPDSWNGYSSIYSQWEGRDTTTGNVVVSGPIITLRHPQWTATNQREDMPVMVFTLAQWALIGKGNISLGAAPVGPSILGQNSKYLLALPARYNFDSKTGWEEVDGLVHTLKAFEPTK